jgi:hypothetical protein
MKKKMATGGTHKMPDGSTMKNTAMKNGGSASKKTAAPKYKK